ncbi:MAG: hypothetical protein P4N60_18630 [Verrucomicrobiae bacterium]|nr:hypothetical protein [Verrucomicrobiae bacterium]
MKMKTSAKKKALIAAACVAVYFVAYFMLVHPVLAGPPGGHVRFETYINPVTHCQAPPNTELRYFFWAAHRVDVLVRSGFWSPA